MNSASEVAFDPKLEDFVVAQMICSACTQQLRIPIRHCIQGHILCEFCFFNAKNCPYCGSAKNNARAYMVEKIFLSLTIACKWTKYGCHEKLTGKTVAIHENVCEFNHLNCPLRFDTNCDYIGTKLQVAFHCRIVHPHNTYTGNRIEIIESKNFRDISLRPENFQREYYTFYVKDELFRAVWELKGSLARFSLNRIGQQANPEKKFIYEVGFFIKNNNRIALTLSSECLHLTDDRLHFLNGNYVFADIAFLKRYCSSYGELCFAVNIQEFVNGMASPLSEHDWTINLS